MALTETRWKRYGKDRTYYADETGGKVGYVDNATGEITGERDGGAAEIRAWIAGQPLYTGALAALADGTLPAGTPGGGATRRPVDATEGAIPAVEPTEGYDGAPDALDRDEAATALAGASEPTAGALLPEDDLALNRPGQAARAQADAEYAKRREQVGRFRAWAGQKLNARTDERAWRIGADAEESVGEELERLRKHGWQVLHAVPVGHGDSDIDHILIGPGGVITVNTKHHPGANVWVSPKKVLVNGNAQPYLRNSRFEAERASRLLTEAAGFPVHAVGCLVFRLRDGKLTIKEPPGDVLVYRALTAYPALRDANGILTADEIDRVYEVARRRDMWQQ